MRADDQAFLRHTHTLRHLVRDKWTPAILVALEDGPKRPSEILATLNSPPAIDGESPDSQFTLHDSILARTLRKLLRAQLVERHADEDSFPPRVFYSLTPAAREFLELERGLAGWVGRHVQGVAARRNLPESASGADEAASA